MLSRRSPWLVRVWRKLLFWGAASLKISASALESRIGSFESNVEYERRGALLLYRDCLITREQVQSVASFYLFSKTTF